MATIKEDELLKNEHVERVLSPHPLSFIKLQLLCIFLIIWGMVVGWLVNFSVYKGFFSDNTWYPILLWGLVLLLVGVVISLASVQWSIFFLYLGVFVGGVALILSQSWLKEVNVFIPVYSIAVSIVGFLIVEMYRRSHKYIITNLRVMFKGGVLTKRERTLRYDKIADISTKQGILGQIFGFGTITPRLSGEKSAEDEVKAVEKKSKLGIFGGGKEDKTPQERTYYELHGIYPYKDIRKLIENMVQGHVITPYQKEQVEFHKQQLDVQKQMRDILKMRTQTKKGAKGKPVVAAEQIEEGEEKEEAFQPEQIDIQKQMKDLLKKQVEVKDEQEPEEEQEEEESKS